MAKRGETWLEMGKWKTAIQECMAAGGDPGRNEHPAEDVGSPGRDDERRLQLAEAYDGA